MKIKDLWNNSTRVKIPVRRNSLKRLNNSKKFLQIIGACILATALLLIFNNSTEADSPKYKASICDTNKCKARVERLNKCNWNVECAVNLTLEASYNHLHKELSNLEKESSKAQKIGLKQAVEFVWNFEGFRKEAYFDWWANGSDRWSIWYGTKSYKWEVITKQEAIKRKMAIIEPLYNNIPACFTTNQKISLTSYMYNVWQYAMNISNYVKQCKKKDVVYIMSIYWYNEGLETRRKKEKLKFNS